MLKRAQKDGLLNKTTDIPTLAEAMWASVMGVLGQARLKKDMEIIRNQLPDVLARFVVSPPVGLLPTLKRQPTPTRTMKAKRHG